MAHKRLELMVLLHATIVCMSVTSCFHVRSRRQSSGNLGMLRKAARDFFLIRSWNNDDHSDSFPSIQWNIAWLLQHYIHDGVKPLHKQSACGCFSCPDMPAVT